MNHLIDTHAHLDDKRLWDRIDEVLSRAREAGVLQVLAVGTTAESSVLSAEFAARTPGVFATVGIHPNHVFEQAEGDFERVRSLAGSAVASIVAIGETGLDRYWKKTPFDEQRASFEKHLDLANDLDLPIVIHCRESDQEILDQLRARNRPIKGVLHSFTGDWDLAQKFLDLGLHLSFAGQITFTNKSLVPLRNAASRVPIDRLLVETDSPYLTPHPYRGERNEPARVAVTARKLAEIRDIDFHTLAVQTSANATKLFALAPHQTLLAPNPRD